MNKKRITLCLLALLVLLGCLSGCEKAPEPTTVAEASQPGSVKAMGRYVQQEFPLPTNGYPLDLVTLSTGQLRAAVFDEANAAVLYTTNPERTDWVQTKALPEEISSSGSIDSLALSPDGTVFCSTIRSLGEKEYEFHFWVVDPDEQCREIPLTYPDLNPTTGFLIYYCDFTDDGRLLAMFYFQDVREIDLQTGALSENINQQIPFVSCLACAGQSAYILSYDSISIYHGGKTEALSGILAEQIVGSLQATEGNTPKITFWENTDGYLFFTTHDGLYSYAPGGSVTEELISGARSSLGDPTFYPDALTGAADGSFYVLGYQGSGSSLYHYLCDPNAPTVADTQLSIYSLYDDEDLRQMISQYQISHPEVSIDLEIGLTGEGGITEADAIRTLNTRILAGSGPDLLRLDGFSLDTYLSKGLLADVSDVLTEPTLEQVTKCYASDGKVCAVPTTFTLPALYGAEQYMSQIHDLDSLVEAARQARADVPENKLVVRAMNPVIMANIYYDSCSAAWLNADGTLDEGKLTAFYDAMKQLYALDEAFRLENAEWVASMADEIDDYLSAVGEYTGLSGAREVFTGFGSIDSGTLDGMLHWSSVLAGEEKFLGDGYATIPFSGQASNVFLPRRIMGILTTSANQHAAKQFLSFMLSEQVQSKDLSTGFPVNQAVFDREIAEDRTVENYHGTNDLDGNRISFSSQYPDARRRQELKTWVDSLTTPALTNRIIRTMVMAQMSDCCNGIITPEQAAKAAVQSLNLYLSE